MIDVVVVVVALERRGELVGADARGDDERAEVIAASPACRRGAMKSASEKQSLLVLALARHREARDLGARRRAS